MDIDKVSWDAVGAISTSLGTLVLLVTAVLALRQLREMAKDRTTQSLSKVFEMLLDEKVSAARRYVRTKPLPDPGKHSEEEWDRMYRVWVSFDNLGIFYRYNLVRRDIVLQMFHGSVIECWLKLRPHILEERRKRARGYQIFFEHLYRESQDFETRLKNGEQIALRTDGTPPC